MPTLTRVHNTWTSAIDLITTPADLAAVLAEAFPDPDAATQEAIAAMLKPPARGDVLDLGMIVEEVDLLHRDDVTDAEWGEWIARTAKPAQIVGVGPGVAWEADGVRISMGMPATQAEDGSWPYPGGPVQVIAIHAPDREKTWVKAASWGALRNAVDAAYAAEAVALEDARVARAAHSARFDGLHAARKAKADADTAAEAARREVGAQARALVAQGVTYEEIARQMGVSKQAVAKWLPERPTPAESQ